MHPTPRPRFASHDLDAIDRRRQRVLVALFVVIASVGLMVLTVGAASGEDSEGGASTAASEAEATPVRELPNRRTATSRTFELSDGQLEARVFEVPVNYRDEDGEWRAIDEGLTELPGGAVTNGANSFDLHLPENLDGAPVRIDLGDGHWVTQQPLGTPTRPVALAGEVAAYEGAGSSVGFEFTGLAQGLKENIVLAGPSAPPTYRYAVEASAGINPELTNEGSLEFRNPEGALVGMMPPPVMADSASEPKLSNAIHYAIEPNGSEGWILSVEADPNWLADPDRAWPVRIDPTLTVSQPAVDCFIGSSAPQASACAPATSYQVAKANYPSGGSDQFTRVLLRFNVSSIPVKASLTSAAIGLFAAKSATNVTKVDLYDVNRNWSSAATWNNYSGTSAWTTPGGDFGKEMPAPASVSTATRGSGPGWWDFSSSGLLNLVSGWHEDEDLAKKGVLLKLADEAPRVCCIERRAEWESSAGTYKPRLVVQYVLPATADSKVTSPTDGTKTAKRFLLTSAWDHSNVEGVTFQYKNGYMWSDIPSGQVTDKNNQAVNWPYSVDIDDRENEPLYWNASSLAGSKGTAKIRIRAVLSGSVGAGGYTKPVEAELDQNGGGFKDAAAPIGPGVVNLLTGNFTVSRTDVSIPGFESSLHFSRSISSRETSVEQSGVLGQGWKAGAPVEVAGSAWRSLRVESFTDTFEGLPITEKWATLAPIEGQTVSFEVGPTDEFVTPPEMSGTVLSWLNAGKTEIGLTDPGGNKTTFSNFGSGSEYWPVSVTQTGGPGNKTRMTYVIDGTKRRLTRVIAPAADGISCGDETAISTTGCRVLLFTYENAKKWGAPESLGQRLAKITFHAPGLGGPWDVASFSYDSQGRLTAAWDPRISPTLKETYAYESGGQLKTITPPGQEPWTMTYGTISGETTGGRLMSVKRPSLVGGNPTAQTTIAYGIPTTKTSGGPYEMSPQEVSRWGQEDLPIDATAIFPPDEVPANPPSSYARAAVFYMDAEGQGVNAATPQGAGSSGESITTTETDAFGNISRELTAENRLRALAEVSGSAAKSEELDTQYKYSADGSVLLDERGPIHNVQLESGPEAGTIVPARSYRSIQYDKDAPEPKAGEPMPLLPTHETSGALVGGKVLDQHTIEHTYDWVLRQQTGRIADPEGLEIKSTTKYDPITSLPIEVRQPKDAESAGAGTTKITYYSKDGTNGTCASKVFAGRPCRIEPASQPASGPQVPVTKFLSYSALGRPLEIKEETGGSTPGIRTTVFTYDAAGRQTSKQIVGGGSEIRKTETLYSSSSGIPTTQRFVCPGSEPLCDKETITATFDALGRITKYQDADGSEATATYDLNGRPATFNDGKGTQAFGYDPATGMLVSLTDSMAGTFTAAYDADGVMVKRGLPNGLTAEKVYDAAGAATDLTYTKASNCGASCTWLDFGVVRSASGKILSESGTLGTDRYSYDPLGRLAKAEEEPPASGCTTRSYAYDANSNRTSTTTRQPGVGGVCSSSGGSTQTYGYDGADRLEGAGLAYDAFGRITTLPSAFAGGGTLVTSYFSNDMIASQSQGGVTNTFALDAALRQRQRTQGGGIEGTEVFHYAGNTDSPAWTQLGETWTRNITGIGGELAAVSKGSSPTRLQLTNLHGDVVATASTNPSDSELSLTARLDEFGRPVSGTPSRFGWLGGAQRRTEFPSGVIQMGARSYVPAIGRFLSKDQVAGGSANAYDYGNADPVNQFDPSGMKPYDNACDSAAGGLTGCQVWLHIKMWSPRGARMGVRMIYKSNRAGGISRISFDINYWVDEKDDLYKEGFVEMAPPHYLNSYPGIPSSCGATQRCANNHDGQGTFACRPGNEYQIQIIFKYNYNIGSGVEEPQILEVEAQEFCRY